MKQEAEAFDHFWWAKRPQSQNAWDLIVAEANVDPRFASIVAQHVADGVCDEDLNLQYVWSFAAQNYVRPAWYVRANGERAAA